METYDEANCPHVIVEGEWISTNDVEFVDIAEDFQGYDLMTFNYKGKEYKSRVQLRPSK